MDNLIIETVLSDFSDLQKAHKVHNYTNRTQSIFRV